MEKRMSIHQPPLTILNHMKGILKDQTPAAASLEKNMKTDSLKKNLTGRSELNDLKVRFYFIPLSSSPLLVQAV